MQVIARLTLDRVGGERLPARPSRSPSARRTLCPASTSATTRSSRAATSPISTPSSTARLDKLHAAGFVGQRAALPGRALPSASPAAVAPRDDLPASPALSSATGAEELAQRAVVKDFVSDALAPQVHRGGGVSRCSATAAGVEPDDGVTISDAGDADAFLDQCGAIRFWERDVRP